MRASGVDASGGCFTGTFSEGRQDDHPAMGDAEDGTTWKTDFDLIYTKV